MKSLIIFLKTIQAAAGICTLLLLLNDCRQQVFPPGTTEAYPLQSSFHPTSYNTGEGLVSNYNLAEKYVANRIDIKRMPGFCR